VYNKINSGEEVVRIPSSSELIRMIEADGWKLNRIKGSHHHFKHSVKPGIVTIPHPEKDVPPGTVNRIKQQAGLK
jgi:predicted RNA binding protein YcfA (HicA-like mRNA interferase family)